VQETDTAELAQEGDRDAKSDNVMSVEQNVIDLVEAARAGHQGAWNALVDRYMPLVRSVVRRYRLTGEDAADVSQTTWLRLVEHLDDIREPERLPGWIVSTAKHEALRLLKAHKRTIAMDPLPEEELTNRGRQRSEVDDELLRAERHSALALALSELRPTHRALLLLMLSDPPLTYEQIGARLGMPHGSIGPTRARALAELRNTQCLRSLMDAPQSAEKGC
jgi:RNA polymerase sigma factor (sigma-70 family)